MDVRLQSRLGYRLKETSRLSIGAADGRTVRLRDASGVLDGLVASEHQACDVANPRRQRWDINVMRRVMLMGE